MSNQIYRDDTFREDTFASNSINENFSQSSEKITGPAKEVVSSHPVKNAETLVSRVTLAKFEPWSVMKTVFIYSFFMSAALVLTVYVAWTGLEASGLLEEVNAIVTPLTASEGSAGIRLQDYLDTKRVMSLTVVLAVITCVLSTVLSTLGAFVYNNTNCLIGGVEVTLTQPDIY